MRTTPAAAAARRAAPQRRPRPAGRGAVRAGHGLPARRRDRGAPRRSGVGRPPTEPGVAGGRTLRAAPAVARRRGGRRRASSRPAGGARAGRRTGPTRCEAALDTLCRRRASPRRRSGAPARVRAVAPGPVCRAARSATRRRRVRRRAAPGGLRRRWSCPGVPARWSWTWTRCRCPAYSPGPGDLELPAGAGRRGPGRRQRGTGGERGGGARGGRRRAAGVGPPVRRVHRRTGAAGTAVPGVQADVLRAPDRTLTADETLGPRGTPRVAAAARRTSRRLSCAVKGTRRQPDRAAASVDAAARTDRHSV